MYIFAYRNLLICIIFLQFESLKEVHCFVDFNKIGGQIWDGTTRLYHKTKEFVFCPFGECCNDEYVTEDWKGLQEDLKTNLFGQDLARKLLTKAIKSHVNKSKKNKPLVISLHGDVGTGKTFTSDMIAKHMYKKGLNSAFVHKFVAADFPYKDESYLPQYQEYIITKVKKALAACPRSLFIFEEVEKLQPGVFDLLTSYLDHHRIIDGIHFEQAIYIFISNLVATQISTRLKSLYKAGIMREQITNSHFENFLETGAFEFQGGFQSAAIIEDNLIDHYIPFLPLEKPHVRECIRSFFDENNREATEDQIRQIFEDIVVLDEDGIFATAGCKRIEKKVDLEVF